MFRQGAAICGSSCVLALGVWDQGGKLQPPYAPMLLTRGLLLQSSISAAVHSRSTLAHKAPLQSQMKGMMQAVY